MTDRVHEVVPFDEGHTVATAVPELDDYWMTMRQHHKQDWTERYAHFRQAADDRNLFVPQVSPWSIVLRSEGNSGQAMRILVVEDNLALQSLIAAHLRDRGFSAVAADTGAGALAAIRLAAYDAMILDLGLPDADGMDVLRSVRSGARPDLPILILTARDSVQDRVAGLDAGADDYILKPVDTAELDARLRAVLRRPGRRRQPVHLFEDLRFDTADRLASRNGTAIDLTPREAGLFEELVKSGNRVVVRDAMAERLYDLDTDVSANALEATVSRLRRKLAASGSRVRIETLRGIGYRLSLS